MATVDQLTSRALRMLTVLDHGEVMTSTQSTNGRTALNAMLARWEEDGIAMGWSAQTSGSATAPVPAAAETAVVTNLACEYGVEYGIAIPPRVEKMAFEGKAALERDSLKNSIEPTRLHVPNGEGGRYDINSDS